MKTYTINSEVGLMKSIEAESIEAAKDAYDQKMHYDFDGARDGDYPGSWYFIDEDGIRVEDCTAEMP